MLHLHFFGVHHMIAASEELGRLGKLPDVIVKGIQYEWEFGKDEGLCLAQNHDGLLIDHAEPESLQDRALTAHRCFPQEKPSVGIDLGSVDTNLRRDSCSRVNKKLTGTLAGR